MSDLFDNYGQLELTCSFWLIKDDFEILKINCDFEDAYSIEWLEFFILLSYFKKKNLKQENAIYLYCQLDLWMSCIYMYIILCGKLFWIKW